MFFMAIFQFDVQLKVDLFYYTKFWKWNLN